MRKAVLGHEDCGSLHDLLEKNPRRMPVHDPQSLQTMSGLQEAIAKVDAEAACGGDGGGVLEEEELSKQQEEWECRMKTLQQLSANTMKSTTDLNSHVKQLVREHAREARCLAKHQQDSTVTARKKQVDVQVSEVMENVELPIFQGADLPGVGITEYSSLESLAAMDWRTPAFLRVADIDDGMSSIVEHSVTFGASYKNNPAYTGEGTGDPGRSQRLILPQVGKVLVDKMLSKLMPTSLLDITSIEGGKAFMTNAWYFGMRPGLQLSSWAPNHGACWRILCHGSIRVIVIRLSTLEAACTVLKESVPDRKHVPQWFGTFSKEMHESLRGAGLEVRSGTMAPNVATYIPSGWVVMEAVAADTQLIYGVRKSFYIRDAADDIDTVCKYLEIPEDSRVRKILTVMRAAQTSEAAKQATSEAEEAEKNQADKSDSAQSEDAK